MIEIISIIIYIIPGVILANMNCEKINEINILEIVFWPIILIGRIGGLDSE